MSRETLMHMDGCHFFVWVIRDPNGDVVVSYHERDGQDLRLHGRFNDEDGFCADCFELLKKGRKPYSHSRRLDAFPDDASGAFVAILSAVAEIEKTRAGAGSRPALPVAPDGPSSDGLKDGPDVP